MPKAYPDNSSAPPKLMLNSLRSTTSTVTSSAERMIRVPPIHTRMRLVVRAALSRAFIAGWLRCDAAGGACRHRPPGRRI